MGLLPSRKEIKKFGKKNPIRSMIYLGFIGYYGRCTIFIHSTSR